ncbi:hypothetical protein [Vibrio sp. SCSIO 43155]|uniref:hypothetical protein n=1 Tax=Vibrio sp. SCSIO 43155 TaxID=2819099 RepID=UPI002075AB69|nr:hypothetical protein [Vibrio sp. SCSIO 43155]USD58693.1 hypothetical protein J4N44_27455 [Vibrio sp. SCSIO 43155]
MFNFLKATNKPKSNGGPKRLTSKHWVVNLNEFSPAIFNEGSAVTQAAFNVAINGSIWLTDNKVRLYHQQLHSGKGESETRYGGLYCWGRHPKIYIYPHLESVLLSSDAWKGIASLNGVHSITIATPIISQARDTTVCLLGELEHLAASYRTTP